ncbi:unnamed protein product [Adineta steineri]|uniref:Uncharacterized protein n=1 Tax=Adineta steineri TaxID=433720 RepID=A0A815AN41_9BILA|nr:unnamed protein product [Adineta steineri]CAF1258962.1 unnamed protein product [Adineta steineri]
MVPKHHYLDEAWSEFERFSTNDYMRQLVDAQANAASDTIMADIPSELSPTSTDEYKGLQSSIKQLKDELIRLRTDTDSKSSSTEPTASDLQNQIKQIDNRCNEMMTEMTSFQKSLNWIMEVMVHPGMNKDPPLILPKPRKFDSRVRIE